MVKGWLPGLERRVNSFTDAYSRAQAIRNVCQRDKLPFWAPKYLDAYEVPSSPPDKHGEPEQQRLL
ncbi:MAG: hypothetical protein A2728_02810 [Candidatus Spechtbacteria bacterium RIFCSPHIGHO2_01_FULL_38_11]|nr:MAG: hypothetical protein A2728_02810 [Candidatus Spechtbacteria bacterium RIFCSPHIGHO2_01_FULL_38_11]OGZ60030.1 MAG: hypothetical protein A3E58_01640 [Candidatus Spechtbacteria bacterium RIFCSPHIGHO2_12_FULL_38_30]